MARDKWLHHCLKTLQRELKKAKGFEARKLVRRLKQAEEGKAGMPSAAGLDKQKLILQQDILKALSPEDLAKRVGTVCLFCFGAVDFAVDMVQRGAQVDAFMYMSIVQWVIWLC